MNTAEYHSKFMLFIAKIIILSSIYNLQLPVRSATWNLASHSIVYIWLLWYLYCELLWSPTSKSIQSSMKFSRELLQEKICEIRGSLNDYYTSLQAQLRTYYDQNVSAYHVQTDGNCLYRSLSHIIFGTENCFDIRIKVQSD